MIQINTEIVLIVYQIRGNDEILFNVFRNRGV